MTGQDGEEKKVAPSKTDLRRGRIQQSSVPDAGALISEDEQDFLFSAGADDAQKEAPES